MFTAKKDSEVKLVETAQSIDEERASWQALHFNFSQLLEHYRSDYQIKIALNLINDLLKNHQGGIFLGFDGDIIIVCRSVNKNLLDKVVFQLRYLFMDDPLAYLMDGQENAAFCTAYDLASSYDAFLALCKRRMGQFSRRANAPEAKVAAAPVAKLDASGQKSTMLTPAHLANIERELSNADLSRVLRRQPICAAVPGMAIRKVFDEIYINIAHLRQFLKLDVDLLSNRWLFKYLTQVLDERMIDMLRGNIGRYFDAPVSLNLNVKTLLSDRFAEFDAAIKPAVKVSIVVEIQLADVFEDMSAFIAAKDFVQRLGYRVCLDGLTSLSFTQVDRERLGFDLAKLQWNADIESDITSKENKKVAEAIRQCGPNRIILCRCDSRHAIDYGQALGVSLFQGRYLDSIMNPAAKIEN